MKSSKEKKRSSKDKSHRPGHKANRQSTSSDNQKPKKPMPIKSACAKIKTETSESDNPEAAGPAGPVDSDSDESAAEAGHHAAGTANHNKLACLAAPPAPKESVKKQEVISRSGH